MKLSYWITINSVICIILGIAFALYAPLMLNFFGVTDLPSDDVYSYWSVAAFARMYGAALFGFGFVLWALRTGLESTQLQFRRGIIFSLILANIMAAFVTPHV